MKCPIILLCSCFLIFESCKKERKDPENESIPPPRYTFENSRLSTIKEVAYNGNDTVYYDFVYDAAGSLTATGVSNQIISYPTDNVIHFKARDIQNQVLWECDLILDARSRPKTYELRSEGASETQITRYNYDSNDQLILVTKISRIDSTSVESRGDSIFFYWFNGNIAKTETHQSNGTISKTIYYQYDETHSGRQFADFGYKLAGIPFSDFTWLKGVKVKLTNNYIKEMATTLAGNYAYDTTRYFPSFDTIGRLIKVETLYKHKMNGDWWGFGYWRLFDYNCN